MTVSPLTHFTERKVWLADRSLVYGTKTRYGRHGVTSGMCEKHATQDNCNSLGDELIMIH